MAASPLRVVPSSPPEPPYPADISANGWRFELDMWRVKQSMTWLRCPPDMRPWLLMLWSEAWMQIPCGSLPAEDADVAIIIGMAPTLFVGHKHVLMAGWEMHADGRLYHRTITELVTRMMSGRKADRARQKVHREKTKSLITEVSQAVTRDSRVSHTTGTGTGTGSKPKPTAQPDGFAEWWAAYPRKTDKQAAMKAWRKLSPDPPLRHVLLAAVAAQQRTDQWQRGIYPHGATWLNRRRWEDEVAVPAKPDGWVET